MHPPANRLLQRENKLLRAGFEGRKQGFIETPKRSGGGGGGGGDADMQHRRKRSAPPRALADQGGTRGPPPAHLLTLPLRALLLAGGHDCAGALGSILHQCAYVAEALGRTQDAMRWDPLLEASQLDDVQCHDRSRQA